MGKILSLIVLFISFNSFASNISIISDLDDTLKITNVQNFWASVRNALFNKTAFKGMPDIYNEMDTYTNGLYVLTASPKFLNGRVRSFLKHNDVHPKRLFMRNLIKDSDKRKYKLKIIRGLLNSNVNDSVILVGDDVDNDHEIYAQIKQEFPSRITKIYIHKIKNRKLPEGITGYITSYDIALSEYLEGRMTELQTFNFGKSLLDEMDLKKFIPNFAFCPSSESDFPEYRLNVLSPMTKQIQRKIKRFCRK